MINQKELFDSTHFVSQSNPDIEELVLACFINYSDTYTDNADCIGIKDFSSPENKVVFYCIMDLIESNTKIDIATVINVIKKRKWDETFRERKNGFDLILHVEEIVERVSTDENVRDHIKELNEYTKRRELTNLSERIKDKCSDFEDTDEIIEDVSKELYVIQELSEVNEITPEGTIKEWIDEMEDKTQRQLIMTGIKPIDEFTGGFRYPDQIIIAANASMGKTSLVLQIFDHNIQANVPCGFFSLEMDRKQLMDRMIALNTGLGLRQLKTKQVYEDGWIKINKYIGQIEDSKFFIDDRSSKLSTITNKIRKWVIRHKVKFIVIDYLQLVSCDSKTNNREQEIASISRRFKELARELQIVIFALSQLNRNNAGRSDKRPVLSDLRESGSIEQDADVVMFIHREEYYQPGTSSTVENAEIIFAKGRSIGVGSVDVLFKSEITKFYGNVDDMPSYEQKIHQQIALKSLNINPDEIKTNDETPF